MQGNERGKKERKEGSKEGRIKEGWRKETRETKHTDFSYVSI